MGLKETTEKLKEQIEEAKTREAAAEETALAEFTKQIEEPVKEEVKEEPIKEEVKAEPEAVEEKTPEEKTPSEHAKERVAKKKEKDRLSDELAAANARIAALEASFRPVIEAKKEPVTEFEPDRIADPVRWLDWKVRDQEQKLQSVVGWKAEQEVVKSKEDLHSRALNEIKVYEQELRKTAPDYDAVKDWFGSMLATSFKMANPDLPQAKIIEIVNDTMFRRAVKYHKEGYENPIEAIYLEAKNLGYRPQQQAEKEEPKPDMDKVSNFRKRNAGTAGSSGSGGDGDVSATVAAKMTNKEWSKLKPEQKKRVFASLQGRA